MMPRLNWRPCQPVMYPKPSFIMNHYRTQEMSTYFLTSIKTTFYHYLQGLTWICSTGTTGIPGIQGQIWDVGGCLFFFRRI